MSDADSPGVVCAVGVSANGDVAAGVDADRGLIYEQGCEVTAGSVLDRPALHVAGGVERALPGRGEQAASLDRSGTAGGFVGDALPEVDVVVGTMQPARFTAGPALPAPTATADAPRLTAGPPLPQRYTRRT